jgi:hypothetical protein
MKIIDDFLNEPYKTRKLGLQLATKENIDLKDDKNGAWPGVRISLAFKSKILIDNVFSDSYINKVKSHIGKDVYLEQSSIQWVSSIWGRGVVHCDYPNDYICITYLNEDPPSNSGTEVYSDYEAPSLDLEKILSSFDREKKSFYLSNKSHNKRNFFLKKVEKINSRFKDPVIASNKFNRTIIYNARLLHRGQDFFGDDLDNSRMTLVSFWNAKK